MMFINYNIISVTYGTCWSDFLKQNKRGLKTISLKNISNELKISEETTSIILKIVIYHKMILIEFLLSAI